MSERTQRLKVLFDWIVKSDLEGNTYLIDDLLKNNSVSFSDQLTQIGFLNANEHMALIQLILESDCSEILKEYLIQIIKFEINRLESLGIDEVDSLLPLLDEYQRIEPSWDNFQYYYDRLTKVPIHLLNEGYQKLVDHYPAELASTIEDNLENIFILNNDLSLEAYSAFIKQINPEPFTLTGNFDWDKIHFLDKNRYLEYSEETLTSLFQWIDKTEENRRLLIKILESFDKDKLQELLKIWLVEVKEDGRRIVRVDFIKSVFYLSTEIDLQTIIFQYCLSNIEWQENSSFEKRISINKELLFKICENAPNDNLRVQLIIEFFSTITAEDLKNIRTFFAVFEDDQFKKLERNTRTKPIIENNQINQKLVELLLENDIVKKETENTEEIFLVNKPF